VYPFVSECKGFRVLLARDLKTGEFNVYLEAGAPEECRYVAKKMGFSKLAEHYEWTSKTSRAEVFHAYWDLLIKYGWDVWGVENLLDVSGGERAGEIKHVIEGTVVFGGFAPSLESSVMSFKTHNISVEVLPVRRLGTEPFPVEDMEVVARYLLRERYVPYGWSRDDTLEIGSHLNRLMRRLLSGHDMFLASGRFEAERRIVKPFYFLSGSVKILGEPEVTFYQADPSLFRLFTVDLFEALEMF